MFTIYREAFPPAQKPYRIGILFTHKNGDFYAISLTERICATPISKLESHISDMCSHSISDSLLCRHKKPSVGYSVNIALEEKKTARTWMLTDTERPKSQTVGVGWGREKTPLLFFPWELARWRNFCPLTSQGVRMFISDLFATYQLQEKHHIFRVSRWDVGTLKFWFYV